MEQPNYQQDPCVFSGEAKKTFFLENQKIATHKVLILNQAYILPDITQHHFEIKIRYDNYFINNSDNYAADDSRIKEYSRLMENGKRNKEEEKDNLIRKFVVREAVDNNLGIEKLLSINTKLRNSNGKQVNIYIDGSVINSGSKNIAGIAGLNFYDENHNLLDEMYISIESWVSPIKAETFAFLIALIVGYNIENIIIHTDSETVCKRFEEVKKTYNFVNARKIYKEQNNIYFWALIRTLVVDENILVPKLVKVKAHADNYYHNALDEKIKLRFEDWNRTYVINLEYGKIPSINYLVLWNNVIIEKPLRRFIRYYTDTCNIESFFDLNRNSKYRCLGIDWFLTFKYLEEDESALSTSFWTTRRRRKKIQRLIEEIPMIEQCKKLAFEIFKNWKCVRCNRKKEIFNHVWMCSSHKKRIREIIDKALRFLVIEIKNLERYEIDLDDVKELFNNNNFGKLIIDNDDLTFIDIIKGIFPIKISDYLIEKIRMIKEDRIKVSLMFLNFIYNETKLIWDKRCELQISKEKRLNIISKNKKLIANGIGHRHTGNNGNIFRRPTFNRAEGLLNSIYFNKKPLDFIVYVIQDIKFNQLCSSICILIARY